jgi:hypothetical protein
MRAGCRPTLLKKITWRRRKLNPRPDKYAFEITRSKKTLQRWLEKDEIIASLGGSALVIIKNKEEKWANLVVKSR